MKPYAIDPTRANKNWNTGKILEVWGSPYDFETVKSLGHHVNAGNGTFQLPSEEDLKKLVAKHDKGHNAHVVRILLAYIVMFSTLSIHKQMHLIGMLYVNDPVEHPIADEDWDNLWSLSRVIYKARGATQPW